MPSFPQRSPPRWLHRRSLWQFEASPCEAAPGGLPPSSARHRFSSPYLHRIDPPRSWRNGRRDRMRGVRCHKYALGCDRGNAHGHAAVGWGSDCWQGDLVRSTARPHRLRPQTRTSGQGNGCKPSQGSGHHGRRNRSHARPQRWCSERGYGLGNVAASVAVPIQAPVDRHSPHKLAALRKLPPSRSASKTFNCSRVLFMRTPGRCRGRKHRHLPAPGALAGPAQLT